jgi:hypothetical protein
MPRALPDDWIASMAALYGGNKAFPPRRVLMEPVFVHPREVLL